MADENLGQIPDTSDDDSHVTIEEFQENTGISHGIIHGIISDCMDFIQVIAPYIPKHLITSQRVECVPICKENLAKFEQ